MKKILLLAILFLGMSYLHSAGGFNYQYFYVNSTGTVPISFSKTSTEIYILKISTAEAYVNFVSTSILTTNLTNYFYLPATDTNNAIEIKEEINSSKMSIYSAETGVVPNIRIQVKRW